MYLNFEGFIRCIMQQQAINKSQECAYLWSSPTSKCSRTLLKLKSKQKCEIFCKWYIPWNFYAWLSFQYLCYSTNQKPTLDTQDSMHTLNIHNLLCTTTHHYLHLWVVVHNKYFANDFNCPTKFSQYKRMWFFSHKKS